MAGFREFMAGQVWFYYNPAATKDQERKKELGAITSRPVVIIQQAFYPEWNDNVTVCPMTHSDRRSGVFIDSTICKDGSLVEGGTVLPYLIYNIKAKYLYPMISSNHRKKLLSLSYEDFEKVRQGYLYHLGETRDVPDYVKEWKHVSGYDREIIIHDVKLAIHDFEDAVYGSNQSSKKNSKKSNPVLVQAPPDTTHVENHLIATLTEYDRANQRVYEAGEEFNSTRLGQSEVVNDGFVTQKDVQLDQVLLIAGSAKVPNQSYVMNRFEQMPVREFAETLGGITAGVFPVYDKSRIFKGSTVLSGVELKHMPDELTDYEKYSILRMTISEILECTGIQSKSTASRLRTLLRFETTDPANADAPEPFLYNDTTSTEINRSRLKKNARRRKVLFSYDKEKLESLYRMPNDRLTAWLVDILPASYTRMVKQDIAVMYPALTESQTESKPKEQKKTYEVWETLSPSEIREIKSCDKRNISSIAKNFNINKEMAKKLRSDVLNMTGRKPSKIQPTIDGLLFGTSCVKIFNGQYEDVDWLDMLNFCRTDPIDIIQIFSGIKMAKMPSKSKIRAMKTALRNIICPT